MSADKLRNLQFIDEKERLLFAEAQLGHQVLDFLQSPTGRYLHGRAKAEFEQAQVEALEIDPDSWLGRRKLRKLRARAEFARHFLKWCVEAINDGEIATQEISNYRKVTNDE